MKLELDTPDKPEVVGIAARLKIDQDAVTGKLVRIWAWADRNSVDGQKMLITPEFIDRLTNKRGFAGAMQAVGWLVVEDGFLTFPGFERHNGSTAKARAEGNRRVVKHRAGKCNGGSVTSAFQKPLPEKRREESITPLPPFRGGEGGSEGDLISKILGLRKEWAAVPMLSDKEAKVFRKNQGLLEMFPAESWEAIREFLKKPAAEGDAYFRPEKLIQFLLEPGGVMARAVAWKAKQGIPRFEVVKAAPVRTAEDEAALKEFLKVEPKRMNS